MRIKRSPNILPRGRATPSLVPDLHNVSGTFLTPFHRRLLAEAEHLALDRRWEGDGSRRLILTMLDVDILFLIFAHTNLVTGQCDPTMARLAALSGQSKGRLPECIRRLEAAGLLLVTREQIPARYGSPPRNINFYAAPSRLPAPPPPVEPFRPRMPTGLRTQSLLLAQRRELAEALACSDSAPKLHRYKKKEDQEVPANPTGHPERYNRTTAKVVERSHRPKDLDTQLAWGLMDAEKEARERGERQWIAPVTMEERRATLKARWEAGRPNQIAELTRTLGRPELVRPRF